MVSNLKRRILHGIILIPTLCYLNYPKTITPDYETGPTQMPPVINLSLEQIMDAIRTIILTHRGVPKSNH
ncbi:hypothetical protein OROHE_023539 [Orobanche hederae]